MAGIKGQGLGRKLTEEHKFNIKKNNPRYWKNKVKSPEHRNKIANTLRGHKISLETREKISISKKGKSHPQTLDTRNKLSLINLGKKQSKETIIKRMNHPNVKKILFKKDNQFGRLGKGIFRGGFEAKHEKQILDFIEPSLGFPILRQFVINRNIVDGYCPQRNIVFEVDEKHHYRYGKLRKGDIQRQNNIKNKLNSEFVRIRL